MQDQDKELQQRQLDNLKGLSIDYRMTFASEHGARVLEDLEKRGFFRQSTFDPADVSGRVMTVREGRRSLVLHIHDMMQMHVERLILAEEEDNL